MLVVFAHAADNVEKNLSPCPWSLSNSTNMEQRPILLSCLASVCAFFRVKSQCSLVCLSLVYASNFHISNTYATSSVIWIVPIFPIYLWSIFLHHVIHQNHWGLANFALSRSHLLTVRVPLIHCILLKFTVLLSVPFATTILSFCNCFPFLFPFWDILNQFVFPLSVRINWIFQSIAISSFMRWLWNLMKKQVFNLARRTRVSETCIYLKLT